MTEKDYKDTLNLPKTEFKMKADLATREKEIIKFWETTNLYEKLMELHKNDEPFILHDGPPYANGNIHIGHALNKILKDIVVKSKAMQGHFTPFIPGWDCHGLPIEHAVFKKIKDKEEISPIEVRKLCKEYAEKWIDIQREDFKRLGVIGNWNNPYITMDPSYQADIVRELGKFFEKNLVYRKKKPVYWCPECVTALAEAEIEYSEETSPSIYVEFEVKEGNGSVPQGTNFIIWTTTPWTLPANVAIAVNPDIIYVLFETNGKLYISAEKTVKEITQKAGWERIHVQKKLTGKELSGITYNHPFMERTGKVITADFVSSETGTGIVHIAPGHGEEDYEEGIKHNLPIIVPVDDDGTFTDEAPQWLRGISIWKANRLIIERLKELKKLVLSESVKHSYPHCWRCKKPVVFRATPQWFISVDKNKPTLRETSLKETNNVRWIPEWGKIRMENMLKTRPDWCISRQRFWGVPIVIFMCKKCKSYIMSKDIAYHVAEIFERESADAWYTKDVSELLPENFQCPSCGGTEFEKENDILDVWFDSGSSHAAVLRKRKELRWPADMYLEGSDQHRGWFQASLLESCGTTGKAPYKIVLTHGFTLDGEGKKMSKSAGNIISPQEIIDRFGADILRFWVSSENYTEDVRISTGILNQIADIYRKIRNTFRFMLGNLYDFSTKNMIPYDELEEIDRWAINRVYTIVNDILKSYNEYKFNRIYRTVYNYFILELSPIYLDIIKDTLYCELPDSKKRRSAQTAIYQILTNLTLLLSPILSFTMEEVYQHIPCKEEESVFLEEFPTICDDIDEELLNKWEKLIKIKSLTNKALELARDEKLIGHSLEAKAVLFIENEDLLSLTSEYERLLPYILITSQAEIKHAPIPPSAVTEKSILNGIGVLIEKASGKKCQRCWMFTEDVGEDKEFPQVCKRCSRVLKELKSRGKQI